MLPKVAHLCKEWRHLKLTKPSGPRRMTRSLMKKKQAKLFCNNLWKGAALLLGLLRNARGKFDRQGVDVLANDWMMRKRRFGDMLMHGQFSEMVYAVGS